MSSQLRRLHYQNCPSCGNTPKYTYESKTTVAWTTCNNCGYYEFKTYGGDAGPTVIPLDEDGTGSWGRGVRAVEDNRQ